MMTTQSKHERPNVVIFGDNYVDLSKDYPELKITTLTYRMSMPKLKKSVTNMAHVNGSTVSAYEDRATFDDRILEADFLCQCKNRIEATKNIDDFLLWTGHKNIVKRFWKREIRIDHETTKTLEGYPDDVIIEQIFGGLFRFTLTWIVYPLSKTLRHSGEMFNTYDGRGFAWDTLYFGKELGKRQIIIPAFELASDEREFQFVVPNPVPKSIRFRVSQGSATFSLNGGADHKLNVWLEEAQTLTNMEIELSEISLFGDGEYYKNKVVAKGSGFLLMYFDHEELIYV